jgi:hypothetical protein
VRVGAAVAILAPSAVVLVVSALSMGTRPRRVVHDVPVAVAGAGLGLGALLFQSEVSVAAWVATPLLLAALAVVHVRALFGRGGPLRV